MNKRADIVLIGAGIMSATLGIMIKELYPNKTIEIFERLDSISQESSDAMNNAGTGHSAFCELNYTPEVGGQIDISKAIKIAEQYETSKEFWSFLVERGIIDNSFIKSIPHMSFVWDKDNTEYLKKRYESMVSHPFFKDMEYSEDKDVISEWIPLVMEGRESKYVAATKMDMGTDVNFGMLTKEIFSYLEKQPGVKIYLNYEVTNIEKRKNKWVVTVHGDKKFRVLTPFVFIGAGGGTLPLLQKTDIPESKGFGGFPVSGQWLLCKNQEVIDRHHAKVYGKASVGSPPMSVPHLDTRIINGKRELLFGPYAGFSTRFLKQGSLADLFKSVKLNNIVPLIKAGLDNIPLTKYLISQVRQSNNDRMDYLKEYLPTANTEDWEIEIAGQRVQIIKKDDDHGGVLEFGTEMVISSDGSISALLGASPGASTSVSIMVSLVERCFGKQKGIVSMIPSHGQDLPNNPDLIKKSRTRTNEILNLSYSVDILN
jgi:malate dehydrogenase (quinone)